MVKALYVLCCCFVLWRCADSKFADAREFQAFLKGHYETEASKICTKINVATWDLETDLKNATKEALVLDATLEAAAFERQQWEAHFRDLNPDDFRDEELKRQAKVLRVLGQAILDEDQLKNLTNAVNNMTNIYSTARICPYDKQDCDLETEGLSLEPDITNLMAQSVDYEELRYAWEAWRNATGAKMKRPFGTYVELSNVAARLNNFTDEGASWRDEFESPDFAREMDELWAQVRPLYDEVHKYVATKLKGRYGASIDVSDGLIPAHVLGNMWAQEWVLGGLEKPFPEAGAFDGDALLKRNNFTVLKLFQTADDFYTSLGLLPNGVSYDACKGAMIERPTDGREVVCHASAWDFCDGKNFRIKMCTEVDFEYFTTIHHEMGHIQYFQQYKELPYTFRRGANPGFHEAIGDTIALSVVTPQHLRTIKLLEDHADTDESSVNALMRMAMQKVVFLPYGLLLDKWRWDVFSGAVPPSKWNSHYWKYRKAYQKVKPPVKRCGGRDFDPGAKFHVAADSQYVSYFVAHIVQFQLYRSLCVAAGRYDPETRQPPLHKCDFYRSLEAGKKLKAGLSLGAKVHWSEALRAMTGETKLDAGAILEYFRPLHEFLRRENGAKCGNNSATSCD